MSSDPDFSDSSGNSTSPQSYENSAEGSPVQQVPELAQVLSTLTCLDNQFPDIKHGKPALIIKEQPCSHFRFRYQSEMSGTHGCILGNTKPKSFPSVELQNYPGKAVITCNLVQWNNEDDHPHQLLVNEGHEDASEEVGPDQGYEVRFAGMGIIHPGKKIIPSIIYEKLRLHDPTLNEKELRNRSQILAKSIDLNIVRLKFSAFDAVTSREICQPVFSEPIRNMKSAQTNDLKICRMSICCGRPDGGDEIYLLVEKVNRKDIEVRFVEIDKGEVVWMANGNFAPNDVHHQFAIVVKTPPYENPDTRSDVEVHVELRRPSDGMTSERMPFVYNAKLIHKINKKRKANSYSSIGSSGSEQSMKSFSDIPTSVVQQSTYGFNAMNPTAPYSFNIPLPTPPSDISLGDALVDTCGYSGKDNSFQHLAEGNTMFHAIAEQCFDPAPAPAPLLGRGAAPEPPDLRVTSADLNKLINGDKVTSEEFRMFWNNTEILEYFKVSGEYSMDNIVPDSSRIKIELAPGRLIKIGHSNESQESMLPVDSIKVEDESEPGEHSAYYTHEDGIEVKQILNELCQAIRSNEGTDLDSKRALLERLFDLRMSDGGTFLHMALCAGAARSLQTVARAAAALGASHALQLHNARRQTVLHLAALRRDPNLVSFLVEKGCDPMIGDIRGDTVFHYAIQDHACLAALLDAVQQNNIKVDLDAYNKEKKTALHLAAQYNKAESVKLLLTRAGALGAGAATGSGSGEGSRGPRAGDRDGRTPLHLAAYSRALQAARVLLDTIPTCDVNQRDAHGYSVLQIVCGMQIGINSLELLELLLEKGADPMSHAPNNKPAWVIARDKPGMMKILKPYITKTDKDIANVDEEYETPDEEEEPPARAEALAGLAGLAAYGAELAAVLDRSGGWRALAARARCHALLTWYERSHSPTTTLLSQIKECPENLSSESLALMLRDIGETEAADVVLRHLR